MLACLQGSRLVVSLRSAACAPSLIQFCCSSTSSDKEPQVYHRPQTITKAQYEAEFREKRSKRAGTAESGIYVTGSKRFFLVLTGLYNKGDVPEYISSNMQSRLGDRLRVLFIVTFVVLFFIIFLTFELSTVKSIERKRAGVSNNPKDN